MPVEWRSWWPFAHAVRIRAMNLRALALVPGLITATAMAAASQQPPQTDQPVWRAVPAESGEVHLANIRQLTFGGQNAEAYFSTDGKRIVFQSTRGDHPCDQEYVMNVDGSDVHRVSDGRGRTTCGYFFDHDRRVLFSSTSAAGRDCPKPPDYSHGYVWALEDFDIYTANADGSDLRRLTHAPGYNAESVVSPDGRSIVFTSARARRPRHLHHADRRHARAPAHPHAGLRRRPVVVARRHQDRLPRLPPRHARREGRVPRAVPPRTSSSRWTWSCG